MFNFNQFKPSNTSTGEKSPNGTPKYQSHLGQHLTYMYLLPEAEQTYLKHPIPPHPPQPPQFHAPQGESFAVEKLLIIDFIFTLCFLHF